MYSPINLSASPVDNTDKISALPPAPIVPPAVDLKPWSEFVEDQLQYSSCTANAGTSALELMHKLKTGNSINLSRMYLYYYTRQLSGIRGDQGAYPKDIGSALLQYGVCSEQSWGYSPDNIDLPPSPDAINEAQTYKIKSCERLAGDYLTQIRNTLSHNIPILFNFMVFEDMYRLRGPWQTHNWNYTETPTNKAVGWHEVLIIGYDDAARRVLIENSWGPHFADGGYFGMPYEMFATPYVGELWVINP